jgi:serine/threonine protein phosphatase 1
VREWARRAWEVSVSILSRRAMEPRSEEGTEVVSFSGPPALTPRRRRIYAVGDIHGRADLLERMLSDIRKDAREGDYQGPPILVFLGDYIDRGFQSKEVLDLLLGDLESSFETYFLKGNHEEAMLQFLDTPSMGPRWADFGGMETLVSYGVAPPPTRTSREDWAIASCALNRALPPGHLDFLMSLRLSIQIGGYMFVHAGVRPGVDLAEQSERDLLWIREEFLGDSRPLGAVIVHGHTPAIQPHRDSRRIGIDTGAYLSGRLTAVRLEDDAVAFLSTGPATEFEEGSGTKPEVWS